ncbi:AbrB family transcriptional regulator [Corynebacterium diphtheriae]|uniref:AbrB family transcriptional regulator n=1 Tax=Corynebacterium diphtheriae TaxID=1717 RepID=UPI000246932E|nr:AbrB family transcriptional regulator [Corynebacterium diphtheriae]AEX79693.1 putative membrane protein [Corynebacterium diphtheriae HC03]AEX81987.1 putative membrane protein [Corynebacterium diphtheriae HC04]MBG9247257.1 AbrB family transcriptional regulator [Corynebacterium diphtheriae bv. mitis]MBG9257833.1 AbrB family transcriptional regulator [Corynebacterium diphtheriae bv. mitis]CAB0553412.1 hypothetical protein CIP107508_01224 [Corynebacterium diphtheriae]
MQETGAHFQLVSLTQYLRLLIVSSSLPVLGSFLDHGESAPHTSANSNISSPGVLALLVVFAVAGPHLGKLLHLPAPHLFASMLLTVGLAALLPDATIALPWEMKVVSHILIGFMCGVGITPTTLKLFAKQIPRVLAAVVATIGACALTASGIMEWLGIPYFDAYLATSPGGLETVISLATEAEHSPTIITLQLIRVTIIMLLAGYLAPSLTSSRGVASPYRTEFSITRFRATRFMSAHSFIVSITCLRARLCPHHVRREEAPSWTFNPSSPR